MKPNPPHLFALALLSCGAFACVSAKHAHDSSAPAAPSNQYMELPRGAGSGSAQEVSVLLNQPHLKLATIALRNGTELPVHTAPVPVTIQVLKGDGVVHIAGQPLAVTAGSLISLKAQVEHDVLPREGSDMLLLVHYLRGGH